MDRCRACREFNPAGIQTWIKPGWTALGTVNQRFAGRGCIGAPAPLAISAAAPQIVFKKSPRRVRFWKMFAIEKLPKVLEHFSVIFPMSLRACRIVHTVFALAPWVNRLKNALETGFYSKPTP